MGEAVSAVLAYFGVESNRTIRERGYYICHTANGIYALAKTTETTEALHNAFLIKETLSLRGFPHTDRFMTGSDGLPYAQIGVDRYTLARLADGREPDYANPTDVLTVAAQLGRLHAAARQMEGEYPSAPSRYEVFRRGSELLDQAVKQVRRRGRLSDFDILLIKNAPVYKAFIDKSIEGLNATPYAEMYAQAISDNHICHNALKEEHISITSGGGVYVSHFTSAVRDVQLNDLSSFIRRYALRNGGDPLPIGVLLKAYAKNNPLPDGAEAVLRSLLIYPAPFIKIVEQYHGKKRSWTPASLISRMEAVLDAQAGYDRYIYGV